MKSLVTKSPNTLNTDCIFLYIFGRIYFFFRKLRHDTPPDSSDSSIHWDIPFTSTYYSHLVWEQVWWELDPGQGLLSFGPCHQLNVKMYSISCIQHETKLCQIIMTTILNKIKDLSGVLLMVRKQQLYWTFIPGWSQLFFFFFLKVSVCECLVQIRPQTFRLTEILYSS